MSVLISAIVCTYNRANYLTQALQSLACQTLDETLYEVIVVDNGSTDNTRDIFNNTYFNKSNWYYLVEPVKGLSKARNLGWKSSRGIYIAYMDDDAIAQSDWLEKIVETFEIFKPKPWCVGGNCEPIWQAPRPGWLSDNMLSYLSIINYSGIPIVLDKSFSLAGCNIAYRREFLRSIGGFREDLGRYGHTLLSNDEVYIRQLLDSKGLDSVYHPEIKVYHHIPASRLTKRWFRERTFWQGISNAIISCSNQRLTPGLCIKLLLKRIVWALPRLLLSLITVNSASRFRRQCQVVESVGYISGVMKYGKFRKLI